MKNFKKYELYSGIVYDTMRQLGFDDQDFLVSSDISPLNTNDWIYGPAFTNSGRIVGKDENYADLDYIRVRMYKKINPGTIIVLQTNDDYCAHAGDITCLIYKKLGVMGFITDGNIRDSRRIRNIKLPCFSVGINPIDALSYWAITEYQSAISLPGIGKKRILINPNDMIFADSDSVIVIPKITKKEFEDQLIVNLKREDLCRKRFNTINKTGDVFKEVNNVFNKYGRW